MLVVARRSELAQSPATDNSVGFAMNERHLVSHLAGSVEDAIDTGSVHELAGVQYLAALVADDQSAVPKTVPSCTLTVDDAILKNRAVRAVRDSVHILLLSARVCTVPVDPYAHEVVGTFRMIHPNAGRFPRSITDDGDSTAGRSTALAGYPCRCFARARRFTREAFSRRAAARRRFSMPRCAHSGSSVFVGLSMRA